MSPELSKTARAAQRAVEAGQAKKKEERTPEKAIAELRLNRASGLYIAPTDVDMLLVEYDALALRADARITELKGEAKTMEEVYPDTDADGFTFCGKCGRRKVGE